MHAALLPIPTGWQDIQVFIENTATVVLPGPGAWVLHAVIHQTYTNAKSTYLF
jgi:hypothetical protein